MIVFDMLKSFDDVNKRFWKYIGDALGITPDEPPIVSDYPPIHAVNGEIRLGIEQSKARHPASQETE